MFFNAIPTICEICGKINNTVMIDGKTKSGSWAYMCVKCHTWNGCGLGVGKGQKFELTFDKRWIKVAG